MSHWQPAASQDLLLTRGDTYRRIREFFAARGVLEVDTPLMARSIGTDVNLDPIRALYQAHPAAAAETLYLQTSPEFAMKRLLAAGSGPIYQLCKAFRNGERGRRHNPEFTMLEWYRPGFSLVELMDEVEALVSEVLGPVHCRRVSYARLFEEHLALDPHLAPLERLQSELHARVSIADQAPDRDTCLDLLYTHVVEPALQDAVMITDYPASQAALAKLEEDAEGRLVARRFELVINGMEIANGYDELCDADEQAERFQRDQVLRQQRSLPPLAVDEQFLAALHAGLPACTGVALGVDRLLMLRSGTDIIDQVLAFPFN
ncbi:MAG TPA: EF-P lysine aminoacylase GenX [Pseudomonadaceae bacterium]|nr:EF-P lysine aminoacylase GenX [Pseudomonadaceae bacterium]